MSDWIGLLLKELICFFEFKSLHYIMADLEALVRVLFHGFPVYKSYRESIRQKYELRHKYHSTDELRYVLTGSFREGYPDIVFSDGDVMVMLNPSTEIWSLETQIRVMQPVSEAPAHVKLIIPPGYRKRFEKEYPTVSNFLGLVEAEQDCCFVSAETARKLNERDFLPEFMADQKPSAEWTAPLAGAEDKISVSYTFRSPSKDILEGSAESDRVPAIECTGWPTNAYEWKIRQPRNWPSADVVENIASSGFMIVPKPSDLSGDIRKEWRLSFSNPEAELFKWFTEEQSKVYYLLRSLYARHFKEKLGGVLTSYHFKTVMFWTLEEEDPSLWSEESTLNLLLRVLEKLLRFIQDGFCPHFFIRNHNLCYKTSEVALEEAATEIALFFQDPLVAFRKIVNKTFLGLMPRLEFLTVKVKGRLEKEIMGLPSFMSLEGHGDVELKCLWETLEDTAISIKVSPDGGALLEVYVGALAQGHQFALPGITESELSKINVTLVQEDFIEMDIAQMNQSLLLWLELGKIAVDLTSKGTNDKLFSFLCKVHIFLKEQNGPLDEEGKETMDLIQGVCCTTGAFLATVNFDAKNISYQQLHELVCDFLPINGNSAQSPCNIILALFVLSGATCKMAKNFLD